ncbi:MAG: hypothetical protein Q4B54_03300 [Coriobacteriales bacterium]|nr:hypothetical protein [Coriobacteriales bacterium]
MTRSRKLALIDTVMTIAVLLAWLYMIFFGRGALTTTGLQTLQYFTVDSNLLMGVSALICARYEWRDELEQLPRWVRALRLTATSAVMLTFWVVVLFLGPLWGFSGMYLGANIAFHLLVPLAAIASFCAFRLARPLPASSTLWGIVPMLAYGIYYVVRINIMGPAGDFYGFLYLGGGSIPFVLLIMMAVSLVLSVATWFVGGGRLRRRA